MTDAVLMVRDSLPAGFSDVLDQRLGWRLARNEERADLLVLDAAMSFSTISIRFVLS